MLTTSKTQHEAIRAILDQQKSGLPRVSDAPDGLNQTFKAAKTHRLRYSQKLWNAGIAIR
jgi:hypothetical protein